MPKKIIRFELKGLKQYISDVKRSERIASRQGFRPLMRQTAMMMCHGFKERFDTEGFGRWRALTQSGRIGPSRSGKTRRYQGTIWQRAHRKGYYRRASKGEGPAHRILHWTHRLRRSLTEMGSPYSIRKVQAFKLIFGSKRPEAFFHDEGFRPRGGTLRYRRSLNPFEPNTPDDLEDDIYDFWDNALAPMLPMML